MQKVNNLFLSFSGSSDEPIEKSKTPTALSDLEFPNGLISGSPGLQFDHFVVFSFGVAGDQKPISRFHLPQLPFQLFSTKII